MTKDEIKKALKCCANYCPTDECPYDGFDCDRKMMSDALVLITEQENEIEKLKEEIKQAKIDALNELKEKAISLSAIETYHICNLVDEMIEELKK